MMNKTVVTVSVIFDGEVLRPETPPNLEPNTRYVAVIQVEENGKGGENAWDVLERLAGTVEGPPDWASEHDHYIYGTPKRSASDEQA